MNAAASQLKLIAETTDILPFIKAEEEAQAKLPIAEQFLKETGKVFDLRPAGYMIAVRIYVPPEEIVTITDKAGVKTSIWRPPASQRELKYQSVTATVIAVGPQAWKGDNKDGTPRYPEGPWARIGDSVVIPRFESFMVMFRGVTIALLPDDKIMAVIHDPQDVTPPRIDDKV